MKSSVHPWMLIAALMCGCVFEIERTAGGEDFPNTISALGKAASGGISSHTEWDQFGDIPAAPNLIPSDTVILPALAGMAAAAKGSASFSAAGDTTTWDYNDTALGMIRKYFARDTLLQTGRDTLIYRWRPGFDTSAPGGELLLEARGYRLIPLPYKLQLYRYLNLDSVGEVDQADFGLIQRNLDGTLKIQHTRVWAGPDGDLDSTRDNQVVEYEFLRLRVRDTLDWIRVTDADGDGKLWGAGDSGRVELRAQYQGPAWKPQAERLSLTLLLRLYARGDSSQPLSYLESRRHWDGTTATFAAKGVQSDSLLRLGDTALVTFEKFPPAGAELANSSARFLVRLGTVPWRFSDNALLRFDLLRHWRIGVIRMLTFAFTPNSAVPAGRLDLTGSFTLSTLYEDGGTGDASGTFDGGDIRATLNELRAGARKAYRLRYDVNGSVLERDTLPSPPTPLPQ